MPEAVPSLDSLTPEQAVRAVGLFYDLVPAEAWEGGAKPPIARVETVAAKVRDCAPEEAQPALDGLFAPRNTVARGELARFVLNGFSSNIAFKPYVDEAVEVAAKPNMMIDPLSLTAILAILVLLSPTIEHSAGKTRITSGLVATLHELHVDKLAAQLPAVLKAIPQSIMEKLML
jgi:hypothetical protein